MKTNEAVLDEERQTSSATQRFLDTVEPRAVFEKGASPEALADKTIVGFKKKAIKRERM